MKTIDYDDSEDQMGSSTDGNGTEEGANAVVDVDEFSATSTTCLAAGGTPWLFRKGDDADRALLRRLMTPMGSSIAVTRLTQKVAVAAKAHAKAQAKKKVADDKKKAAEALKAAPKRGARGRGGKGGKGRGRGLDVNATENDDNADAAVPDDGDILAEDQIVTQMTDEVATNTTSNEKVELTREIMWADDLILMMRHVDHKLLSFLVVNKPGSKARSHWLNDQVVIGKRIIIGAAFKLLWEVKVVDLAWLTLYDLVCDDASLLTVRPHATHALAHHRLDGLTGLTSTSS